MSLAFLAPRCDDPNLRLLRAGLVAVRQPRRPPARRDWLRISRRLAGGLTPEQAARAEGTETSAVDALLAQEGFCRLVESQQALEALSPAEQTARLVRLARIALENALRDWDVGAACFVLHENAEGRDPAETIARRALTARVPPSPASPAPSSSPTMVGAGDPLTGLIKRSTAALCRATLEEHADRHAAAPVGAAATAAAARRALARKRDAAATAPPSAIGRAEPAASPVARPSPHPPSRPRSRHRPRAP